jgi:hypothetical protein
MTMSLAKNDLDDIRTLFREEIRPILREEIRPILRKEVRPIVREEIVAIVPGIVRDEVQAIVPGIVRSELIKQISPTPGGMVALENDIKELYGSISQMQKEMNNGFKSLRLNIAFLAKQIGVRLPKTG